MIMTAAALRLAAIEALTPSNGQVPRTLAGRHVFDSRAAAITDMDDESRTADRYTPVLAVYTLSADSDTRGEASGNADATCMSVLEFVGELAVVTQEVDEMTGHPVQVLDAMAGNDPQAHLVLSAMMAQVRKVLLHSEAALGFRALFMSHAGDKLEFMTVPELGLNYHRAFLRMSFRIKDDGFPDQSGLPSHVRAFVDSLPAESYARAKMLALGGYLSAEPRTPLAGIDHRPPAIPDRPQDAVAGFTAPTNEG